MLDDWGLVKLTAEQRKDLLEILDDRHGPRSTIVSRQLPIDPLHQMIAVTSLTDAILGQTDNP